MRSAYAVDGGDAVSIAQAMVGRAIDLHQRVRRRFVALFEM